VDNVFVKISEFLNNKKMRLSNVSNYKKIIKLITKKNTTKIISSVIKKYA
jgi:hypothetical protein